MTAKEMFEELGYKLEIGYGFDNKKLLIYGKLIEPERLTYNVILFKCDIREIHFMTERGNDLVPCRVVIDEKVLKAVNKQREELGWVKKEK